MNSIRILIFASLSLSIGCVSTGKGDDSGVGADGTDGTGADALDCDDTTGLCVLDTAINSDVTLTADYQYVLPGGVFVGDGSNSVTLTIEAGVGRLGVHNKTGETCRDFLLEDLRGRVVVEISQRQHHGSRPRNPTGLMRSVSSEAVDDLLSWHPGAGEVRHPQMILTGVLIEEPIGGASAC